MVKEGYRTMLLICFSSAYLAALAASAISAALAWMHWTEAQKTPSRLTPAPAR